MIKLAPLLTESSISDEDRTNHIFMSGLKLAIMDRKQNNKKRNLSGMPSDFVRGYESVKRPGIWDKINQWLTKKGGEFGSGVGDTTIWRK